MARGFRWQLSAGACAATLLAVWSSAVHAETLQDALALAYQTNPTLQSQRAQLRFTDETYVQARAGYRPTANLSMQLLWQGTNYGSGHCVTSSFTDCSPESTQGSATVNVTQPIWTAGKATGRVHTAEAQIYAGREDLRRIEGQVMLAVITAYADVRRDEQALDIGKANVAVLQRQVDESRARFDVGEVTRTDVAQSEAQLAVAQSQLSTAQAQLAVSRAAYASAVGQSPGTLEPEPSFHVFPETVEQAFDTSEQNSPAIGAADYNEQSAEAQLAEAKAQNGPTVSVQAQYGYSQLGSGTSSFSTLSHSYHPFDRSLYDRNVTAGVVIAQPLFTGGLNSSVIRQAVERVNFSKIQLDLARRQAVEDISQNWNRLLAARANIASGEEQVRASRIAFEGTRAEQQVGLRTTLEVLSAQQVLRAAELSLINARHDEYVASASVLNVMGLLEAHNLVANLEPIPGSHSFGQLKHVTGYVPVIEEGVSTLDGIGHPGVKQRPAPLEAPITTAPPASTPSR